MISTGHNFPFAVKLGPMVSAILFTYTLIILVGKNDSDNLISFI